MKDVKEIIAENLTMLRLKNNLTQTELAKKINYTDKSVSKWEHFASQTGMSKNNVQKVKKILDMSMR